MLGSTPVLMPVSHFNNHRNDVADVLTIYVGAEGEGKLIAKTDPDRQH